MLNTDEHAFKKKNDQDSLIYKVCTLVVNNVLKQYIIKAMKCIQINSLNMFNAHRREN